ncbi:MAG: glycosyltransferase family 2 protein [Parasporobacterium sp.]|nr:glycosyltransferase family 2 protein [Parasporobacterium sp.]
MKSLCLPPKISIIIPVYNVENYIAKCLDTCIAQTLYDIEIVCVDDGSTDGSGRILDHYAALDNRVKVIHKQNAGVSAARNDGIRASSGTWLMFVDSDDYLALNACEVVWKESLSNSSELIVHGGYLVPDYPKPESWKYWGVITDKKYYREFEFRVLEERGSNPFLWLQAFRRDLLERTGVWFREDISFGEDIIFQFENLPFAKGISFIKDRLYYYRWYRDGSLMKEATADLDARTMRHILNIGILADYWLEHGLMEKYGDRFLGWAVGFVVPDLEQLELKDPKALASALKETLESRGLDKFRAKLPRIPSRQYRKMVSLAKG